MNVLIMLNHASAYGGNLLASLSSLADKIADEGGKALFLLAPDAKSFAWSKELSDTQTVFFKTAVINSKNKADNASDRQLIERLVRDYSIDIIHLHFWNINDCRHISAVKKKNKKLVSIIHHHNEYHVSSSRLREALKRYLIGDHFHVGVSQAVADGLVAAGFKKNTVYTLDNGIDFSRLDNYKEYSFPKNTFLMFSSYSEAAKGIDIAVKALHKLRESGGEVSLAIASRDEDLTASFIKQSCPEVLVRGALPPWILILPTREDIGTYYMNADFFISASRTEGFCYAVLEAIYSGKVTIQSRIPAHRLDVPECITFENENVMELAEKMCDLLAGVGTRDIDEQREYVVSKYGIDSWCNQMVEIYEDIIVAV